jgi:hypothetical protein
MFMDKYEMGLTHQVDGKNLIDKNDTELTYRVELNIQTPTPEELKTLKVDIDARDKNNKHKQETSKVNENLEIIYAINQEDGLQEVQVEVYPQDNRDNGAKTVSYGRAVEDEERKDEGFNHGK